jgi:small subunit ribosomal protein S17
MTGVRRQAQRKTKLGTVVSDRMDKTIVVSVERMSRHALYKRVMRLTSKFKAHDEANEARIGDLVRIEQARPMSATKRWRLVEVVRRAGDAVEAGPIVAEEAETSEAIHMAAHPGRREAEAQPEEAPAAGEPEPAASRATDEAAG